MTELDPRQRLEELKKIYPLPPDDGEMFVFLPFSDIGYMDQSGWYLEGRDKFYLDSWYAFNLARLMHINQLSMLAFVGFDPHLQIIPNHTRDGHVLITTKVIERILEQNGFSEQDKKKGGLAALIHDRGTPAHGDATKKVDPVNLDEEVFWDQDLSPEAEQILLELFETDNIDFAREEMSKIIQNKGMLGQMLDISDRIAYVMADLYWVVGDPATHLTLPKEEEKAYRRKFPEYYRTKDLLAQDREVGNIYKEVRVDKDTGEIYFTSPERLKRFLALRAFLNEQLYNAPLSLGRDLLFAKLIQPFYAADVYKPLSPRLLRQMTDEDLRRKLILYHVGSIPEPFFITDYFIWYPKIIEKFESKEAADKRLEELSQVADNIVLGSAECKGFRTGIDYKVKIPEGEIVAYEEFDPMGAAELEEINRSTQGVYVFYSKKEQEKPEMLRILLELNQESSSSPGA